MLKLVQMTELIRRLLDWAQNVSMLRLRVAKAARLRAERGQVRIVRRPHHGGARCVTGELSLVVVVLLLLLLLDANSLQLNHCPLLASSTCLLGRFCSIWSFVAVNLCAVQR